MFRIVSGVLSCRCGWTILVPPRATPSWLAVRKTEHAATHQGVKR